MKARISNSFTRAMLTRGFTRELAENILAEVKFSSRNEALLKTKQKHPEIFAFHHDIGIL